MEPKYVLILDFFVGCLNIIRLTDEELRESENYENFEDFFLHDMDAVVLANYATEHAPFAVRLLDSGRHVLSEVLPCETMAQAVEDHRASASRAPRSVYGRMVAEADRDLLPETVFRRTIQFGLEHYPEKAEEEQWQRFREHIQQKYSSSGYIHLWILGSENEANLKELRGIIADEQQLRNAFDRIYKDLSLQSGGRKRG